MGGVRHLAKRMLESAGYTVLTAADDEEALLVLERHEAPVPLVITDIVMPRMSGPNLAKECERDRPEVQVLYMSGYTDDVVVRHGVLEEGMPCQPGPKLSISHGSSARLLSATSRHAIR